MNALGIKLKKARESNFMTTEEVAKKLGVSRMTYSALENGTSKGISFKTIKKLAKYLGKSERYVMNKYLEK